MSDYKLKINSKERIKLLQLLSKDVDNNNSELSLAIHKKLCYSLEGYIEETEDQPAIKLHEFKGVCGENCEECGMPEYMHEL